MDNLKNNAPMLGTATGTSPQASTSQTYEPFGERVGKWLINSNYLATAKGVVKLSTHITNAGKNAVILKYGSKQLFIYTRLQLQSALDTLRDTFGIEFESKLIEELNEHLPKPEAK